MSMWRCPHCGTPQAETARCWVCHRSSTTCSTCRNFRRSVAGQVGFCGLDRRRVPLSGTEHRGCWEARGAGLTPGLPVGPADSRPDPSHARRGDDHVARTFIPVELLADHGVPRATPEPAIVGQAAGPRIPVADAPREDAVRSDAWQDRRTLFGEPDR